MIRASSGFGSRLHFAGGEGAEFTGNAAPLIAFVEGVLKMARGRLAFKQRDLTRALRAVSAAGQPVQRVEIDREGKIIVFVGKPEQPDHVGGNEWD